jgi:hypothetical protein
VQPASVTLLRLPLGCLTWTILRLTIAAAVLIAAYLVAVRPLLEGADRAAAPVTHRIERINRCIERAHGDTHRIIRCSAKF